MLFSIRRDLSRVAAFCVLVEVDDRDYLQAKKKILGKIQKTFENLNQFLTNKKYNLGFETFF